MAARSPARSQPSSAQRHRHDLAARFPEGVERVEVGGVVHHHPLAGRTQRPHQQAQGVLSAEGHHDLLGVGGQAPAGVALGDNLAQIGNPAGAYPWPGRWAGSACRAAL